MKVAVLIALVGLTEATRIQKLYGTSVAEHHANGGKSAEHRNDKEQKHAHSESEDASSESEEEEEEQE